MTMNCLPDVNIQGVPQYWTHFFLLFCQFIFIQNAEVGGVLKNTGNLQNPPSFCILD